MYTQVCIHVYVYVCVRVYIHINVLYMIFTGMGSGNASRRARPVALPI